MRVLAGLLSTVACLFAASTAHAADRVVVRFSSSADSADRSAARDAADASVVKNLPSLTGVQVVTVPEGDATSAARALDRQPGVLWAHPDHRVHAAMALPYSNPASGADQQWGLYNHGQTIDRWWTGLTGVDGDFTPAWDSGAAGAGVTIAVVDTGVDFSIDDLRANEGAYQYDFVGKDGDAAPEANADDPEATSHGTAVAGVAAAALAVNGTSDDITGGAPAAKIMPLRALDADGVGYASDVAAAFAAAAEHGARVVNASLSQSEASPEMALAVHQHPNTLFVVAAGNGDAYYHGYDEDTAGTSADYPCVIPEPNVVCVAAIDNRGNLAGFSNYGATQVDVAAPGVKILSYLRGGGSDYWNGTSFATPYVSAAAALALSVNQDATAPQLRQAIIDSAKPDAALQGKTVSGGMLDADALVRAAADLPPEPAPTYTAPPAAKPTPTPTPRPAPVATPTPKPAPAPIAKPAAPKSAKLSLYRPHRRGSRLSISGRVAWSFHRTVTIKVCAGRHCRTARVTARRGRFWAKVRPSRRGRVVVTATVRAGGGFKYARTKRTVRF
jgi:subtilisin family serine protease